MTDRTRELLARAVCLYADDECVSVATVLAMLDNDENFSDRPQDLDEARDAIRARLDG